jgi:hypothetical protein
MYVSMGMMQRVKMSAVIVGNRISLTASVVMTKLALILQQ